MKLSGIIEFFKRPNKLFTAILWISGLGLLAACIAAVVLDLWHIAVRIAVIIVMSLIILYALYATALLIELPEKALAFARRHRTLSRLVDSYNFRTALFACGSVIIDVAYAVLQFVIGAVNHASWAMTNGVYYFILSVIRFFVIMFGARPLDNKELKGEARELHCIKTYAATGIALLILNSVLYVLFDAILLSGERFVKHYVMIYGSAVYIFYRMILAVNGLVKSHINDNLVTRALRNINTVTALVALLTFQTSLLATAPEMTALAYINGTTATLISLITVSLALSMLVGAYRKNRVLEKAAEKRRAANASAPLFRDDNTSIPDITENADGTPSNGKER